VIDGVTVRTGPEAVWVRSGTPLRVVASALVGGDLDATRHIVNMRVPDGYRGAQPAGDLRAFAGRLGIGEPFVGLMTAARTEDAATATEADAGVTVTAVVTVGLGCPVSAGATSPRAWRPSTINAVILVDGRLGRAAAVNGVITATEAKAAALAAGKVVTPDGEPATGTVTDAVVVAWTDRGPLVDYLGPVSPAGWLVARAVRRAITEGLARA
jgi:iron complex transport system ATP-binding protein